MSRNVYDPDRDWPPLYIRILLSTPGHYGLRIYNSAGELVRVLKDVRISSPLTDKVEWDGKNMFGEDVATGVYVIYYDNKYNAQVARVLVLR